MGISFRLKVKLRVKDRVTDRLTVRNRVRDRVCGQHLYKYEKCSGSGSVRNGCRTVLGPLQICRHKRKHALWLYLPVYEAYNENTFTN